MSSCNETLGEGSVCVVVDHDQLKETDLMTSERSFTMFQLQKHHRRDAFFQPLFCL